MTPTKAAVVEALRASASEELRVLEQMAAMARDEATHPESRPENQYDTRALEASYLAAGQGRRLAELRELVGWLSMTLGAHQRAAAGSLVHLAVDGRERWVLLAPKGGSTARVGGQEVSLVSVLSPLGACLNGLAEGEAATLERPGGRDEIELLDVS